jgi:hypothetical protein
MFFIEGEMRRDDVCFERYAKSQGYNTDKNPGGSYEDSDTETLRSGYAPGFLDGIKEARRAIVELEEEIEP